MISPERLGTTGCCGCWRRSCSPRPSRCPSASWPSGCRRAPTSAAAGAACRRLRGTRRAAGAGRRPPGRSPPRPTSRRCSPASGGSRRSCRVRRSRRLPIIAYHQPVTRGDIEEIRGVQLGKGTLDVLFEQGWIAPQGPPRDAGPAGDLGDHRRLPAPLRPCGADRPAGRGGAARRRPARRAPGDPGAAAGRRPRPRRARTQLARAARSGRRLSSRSDR